MAYQYNIPASTDQLSVSQGDIQGNFNVLGAIAGNLNASSASLNSTSGFNWLYLPPQGAIPPASSSFTSGNVALYSANNATTSKNELYINKLNQATVTQIPATASLLSITSAPASNAKAWSYLPSGMIIQAGTISTTGAQTFGFAFPSQTFALVVTPTGTTSTFISYTGLSRTGFTVTTSTGGAIPAKYIAFGY